MKQREVTDTENIRWTCAQAYTMTEHSTAAEAEEISETDNGKVTVVCTPSGGAKTARLSVAQDWEAKMNDEELLAAIAAAK